jgi:hypothetical protein
VCGDILLSIGQVLVFALGAKAVIQAATFLRFFRRSEKPLSWAMQTFLIEQVVSATGTMLFAVNSLVGTLSGEESGLWNTLDPTVAITIRAVMFLAMIHATQTLSVQVHRIMSEREG